MQGLQEKLVLQLKSKYQVNPYNDPDENEFVGIIANHEDEDSDSVFNYYI